LKQDIEKISVRYNIENYSIETISIKPKKGDIFDITAGLLWESR